MEIIWSGPSIQDLENLKNYISQDSIQYASIFINKIIKQSEQLLKYPEIGRIVPERNQNEIREIIFQNYRIIYKVTSSSINILTVCHGSRDLTGWLE